MTIRIVPIFLPNRGCPHRCIFCNEKIAAGEHPEKITRGHIADQIAIYLGGTAKKNLSSSKSSGRKPRKVRNAEDDGNGTGSSIGVAADRCALPGKNISGEAEKQIAFYGGNFTGIDPDGQMELLGTAREFIEKGLVDSIRISTRPDYIDEKALDILKRFPVKTVEIGAQSMDDTVLERCGRGHCAADTLKAVELLKAYGFKTGVHLMPGLPGHDPQRFEATTAQVIAMKPDTVRIHPTLVFADTELAAHYRADKYVPLALEEAVELCARALTRFRAAGIEVIRVGVQTTAAMEVPGAVLAGPFHPAFRSLVEGRIFQAMAKDLLEAANRKGAEGALPSFRVCPRDLSDFRGISNRNMEFLRNRYGTAFPVIADGGLKRGEVVLAIGERIFYSNRSMHCLKATTEETIYM